MDRIVDGVMKTATFLALDSLTGDEITDVYHVAKLADVTACLNMLEQVFGLFVEKVETVPCALQTEVVL